MKKAIIIFIIFLASTVSAEDWSLSLDIYKVVPTDAEAIVQQGHGLQATLQRKAGYLYVSQDLLPVRFGGQRGVDISLWSAGLGFTHQISEYFTFSCDAGWYEPIFSEEGRQQIVHDKYMAEGLMLYLNDFLALAPRQWDYYTLNYHGSIGGKLNVSFSYPMFDWLSLEMAAGYRYLKLTERIRGKDFGNDVTYWTIKQDRDFSGWLIGGGIVVLF